MASVYDQPLDPDSSNLRIASLWWAMALRGAAAIVLGTLAVLWPVITVFTLVLVFAAYCIVDAIFSIVLAVRGARRHARWWWPALNALVALAAAAVALVFPDITLIAFIVMLTAWALLTGAFSIAAAFRVDGKHGRWWLVANGVVSIFLGVLLLIWPSVGLFTLTWMIAFYAWVAGAALLGMAFRLRTHRAGPEADAAAVEERRRHETPRAA